MLLLLLLLLVVLLWRGGVRRRLLGGTAHIGVVVVAVVRRRGGHCNRGMLKSNQRCGSVMFIPAADPNFFHPESRIRIKEFKHFNPKHFCEALGNMIRVVHTGSGSPIQILIFTHPGSRIQRSKRHRIPDPQHWLKLNPFFYK
jgi:hypothetical protein